MRSVVATLLMAACFGCGRASEALPENTAKMELDARDQYALARAIQGAQDGSLELREGALVQVRRDWAGRRYRWQVAFVPDLYRGSGPCLVHPFDFRTLSVSTVAHGWMPRLDLDPEAKNELAEACRAHSVCVFVFEGKLDRFVLSNDVGTSLSFSGVRLGSVRAATLQESWVVRPKPNNGAVVGNPDLAHARLRFSALQTSPQ